MTNGPKSADTANRGAVDGGVVTRNLQDFLGNWQIHRTIADFRGGPDGEMRGTATFTDTGQGLDYFETGLLHLGGLQPMQAERRMLWTRSEEEIAVLYADRTPFHVFNPASEVSLVEHLCAPDTYRGEYRFATWPEWCVVWQVTGPRKNYRSQTRFRRC